jgi:LysM repeat protein
MAIAALPDVDVGDAQPVDLPWPRPELRLVVSNGDPIPREVSPFPPERPPALRTAAEVSVRRHRRVVQRARRRRAVGALAAVGAIALLSLPFTSLAARPLPVHPASASAAGGGEVYVVQPGDTLWSIANRFNQGDPRALVEELAAKTGSEGVFPGERLRLP